MFYLYKRTQMTMHSPRPSEMKRAPESLKGSVLIVAIIYRPGPQDLGEEVTKLSSLRFMGILSPEIIKARSWGLIQKS